MRVLALDTTTPRSSVAIVADRRVLAEAAGDPSRPHAERLPGDALAALDAAGLRLDDIDVFAVAAGPGSFTGLRIGIAAVQGLAFVLRRPVVPVSVLDALGHAGSAALGAGSRIGAWMDAHRREVFAAIYRVADAPLYSAARLVALDAPSVGAPAEILDRWRRQSMAPDAVAGDGAVLYAAMLDGAIAGSPPPPLAATIGRIAVERAAAGGAVDPAAIQPIYIRRPDAELAREARSGA
jgi:tRNA threonylcarbamoyladenosine biosynthesis protein TsaB